MTAAACDACGKPAPASGAALHAGVPLTATNLIGRYGRACARKIVAARLKFGEPTYDHRGRLKRLRVR